MGLKSHPGVNKVTIKMRGVYFTIENPDILKNPGSESYLIFGEPKFQDQQQQQLQQAAQAISLAKERAAKNKEGDSQPPTLEEVKTENQPTTTETKPTTTETKPATNAPTTPAPTTTDSKKDAPEKKKEEGKDVELVMAQANCTEEKAKEALKKSNGDVVNAIMSLMS